MKNEKNTVKFSVNGMHCKSCEMLIRDDLMDLGVSRCEIDVKSGKSAITFDESKISEASIISAIKKLGYEVWYLPKWEIIHLGGASSDKEFPILSEFKGIKLFYKKN